MDRIKDLKAEVEKAGYQFGVKDTDYIFNLAHIIPSDLRQPALCKRKPLRRGFLCTYVAERIVCIDCLHAFRKLKRDAS